jgi:hypothetical protein
MPAPRPELAPVIRIFWRVTGAAYLSAGRLIAAGWEPPAAAPNHDALNAGCEKQHW